MADKLEAGVKVGSVPEDDYEAGLVAIRESVVEMRRKMGLRVDAAVED